MNAGSGLNTGFLVGRDHELVLFERLTVPLRLVRVEDAAGLRGEVGVAGEDPTSMLPRTNGVLVEPAPDRLCPDGGDNA